MTLQQPQILPLTSIDANRKDIEIGLDFILSHFANQEFLFPRKISTYKSQQNDLFQFLVGSKQGIINAFIDSSFVDCQINAYPYLTEYKDVPRYKPEFLFIDIDRNNFKTDRSFENALYNTLKNIKEKLNGYPTILFTGGGYHIYQPVYCPTALENITEFKEFDRPSEQFLRFAKDYLSNGKSDKQNNPSFKSCLTRVPGSIRSKYNNNQPVQIIKKWNGERVPITKGFIEEFRDWLIQKKIDQDIKNKRQKLLNKKSNNNIYDPKYYSWIENLIQTPIEDFRKLVINIILSPYLINVKQLSFEESYTLIRNWLDKCNSLQKLDNYSNFVNYRIHYALKTAVSKGIGPMSFSKIKTDSRYNTNLYLLILQKGKGKEKREEGGEEFQEKKGLTVVEFTEKYIAEKSKSPIDNKRSNIMLDFAKRSPLLSI